MADELLQLLGARRGHFLLESGHHGDLWLDLDSLFSRPDRLTSLTDKLAQRLGAIPFDLFCGPVSGGAKLAELLANKLHKAYISADRIRHAGSITYRIPEIHRPGLRNKKVAMIDDVINAASALRVTLTDLKQCDADIAVIAALLTLGPAAGDLARQHSVPLRTLGSLRLHPWPPAHCPQCAQGVPLENPNHF